MIFLGGGGGMAPLPLGPLLAIGGAVLLVFLLAVAVRALLQAVSRKLREIVDRHRRGHS